MNDGYLAFGVNYVPLIRPGNEDNKKLKASKYIQAVPITSFSAYFTERNGNFPYLR
jgi:hypothetical protein